MTRINVMGFIAGALVLLGIIGLFITMFSNSWYSWEVDRETSNKPDYRFSWTKTEEEWRKYDFGLSEMEESGDGVDESTTATYDYDTKEYSDTDFRDINDTFNLAKIMLIIGIILSFFLLILSVLTGMRLIHGWITFIVAIITFLAIVIGCMSLVFNLPDSMEEWLEEDYWKYDYYDEEQDDPKPWDDPSDSFWGYNSDAKEVETKMEDDVHDAYMMGYRTEPEDSWGPNWAWYVALASGGLILFGGIICKRIKMFKNVLDPEGIYRLEDEEEEEDITTLEKVRRESEKHLKKKEEETAEKERMAQKREEVPTLECKSCGRSFPGDGTSFCPYCGFDHTSLEPSMEKTQENTCIDCGAPVEPPLVFCSQCTAKQGGTAVTEDDSLVEAAEPPQESDGRYLHDRLSEAFSIEPSRYAPHGQPYPDPPAYKEKVPPQPIPTKSLAEELFPSVSTQAEKTITDEPDEEIPSIPLLDPKVITVTCSNCSKLYKGQIICIPSYVECPFCNTPKIIHSVESL